jgi:hypothetical protein
MYHAGRDAASLRDTSRAAWRRPVFDELLPISSTQNMAAVLAFYCDAKAGEVTYRCAATGEPEFVAPKMGSSSVGIARQYHPAP